MARGLHWFRNDLRLRDNTALDALASRAEQWLPVFVLDPRLLHGRRAGSPRSRFLLDCLGRLGRELEKRGFALLIREGLPEQVLPRLLRDTGARLLSFNEDATPFARRRDESHENRNQDCPERARGPAPGVRQGRRRQLTLDKTEC